MMSMDETTSSQLELHGYHETWEARRPRPLLICDVDEVVLHLVSPFVTVLDEMGYGLKTHSFELTGNVFHRASGEDATQSVVWEGLATLFKEQDTRQHVVDGVVEALNSLHRDIDIVFLTNLPHEFGDIRRTYLADHGMPYPLVTNTGSKVSAIERLKDHHEGPVGFIDDTPIILTQVRDAVDDVHLFHFMADETFRSLAGEIEGIDFSSGDWAETESHIRRVLLG